MLALRMRGDGQYATSFALMAVEERVASSVSVRETAAIMNQNALLFLYVNFSWYLERLMFVNGDNDERLRVGAAWETMLGSWTTHPPISPQLT